MTRYYGAKADLENCVTKHVFVMCPNQSGSTFLVRALGLCAQAWSLKREGQNTHGYVGPDTFESDITLTWASDRRNIEFIKNQAAYNWPVNRKTWYFQASASRPDAGVFVTKSPPFLLIADQLAANFKNVRFIFMVRNPYAVVEGIYRRGIKGVKSPEEILQISARHILNCFAYQKSNIDTFPETGTFFTYEDMCARPCTTAQKIQNLVPEFSDLVLDQTIEVKGMYEEPLRDMNADHIGRLAPEALDIINETFILHTNLLDYFGYSLIKS